MRRIHIFSSIILMTMAAGAVACDDGGDGNTDEAADTNTDNGDGDGDTTVGDTTAETDGETGMPGCWEQPPECQRLIECLDVILPGQDLTMFEADGSCWCGSTSQEANDCYQICLDQLDAAVSQNPTVPECHGRFCPIEEIATDEPYGPAPCNVPDTMELTGLPVPGSYCAPACGGVAQNCPEHSQTIAQGVCYWGGSPDNLCALQCYVDPFIFPSGTQCQCGAICRPYGPPDGDGNARGICTYD